MTLNKNITLQRLSNEELLTINGGHDGTAYNVGKALGEGIAAGLKLIGLGRLFRGLR